MLATQSFWKLQEMPCSASKAAFSYNWLVTLTTISHIGSHEIIMQNEIMCTESCFKPDTTITARLCPKLCAAQQSIGFFLYGFTRCLFAIQVWLLTSP